VADKQEQVLVSIMSEMLERSKNALCILDQDSRYLFCNRAMASLIGLDKDKILGRKQAHVLKEAHNNQTGVKIGSGDFNHWLLSLESKQRALDENEFITDTVDKRFFKMHRVRMSSGENVISGTDITDLKNTQFQLEQALSELDIIAHTCELTGVPNRRYLMTRVKEELHRAQRYQSSFSIVLADIDFFKSINDNYGHDVGDQALRHIANIIASSVRSSDVLGRIGGEEFAILMPNTNLKYARQLTERLRLRVEQKPLTLSNEQSIKLTASFGISEYLSTDKDELSVFARADTRLYKAKHAGRNQAF